MGGAERIEVVPTNHFRSGSIVGGHPDQDQSWDVVAHEDPARDEDRPWSALLRSTVDAVAGGRTEACWSRPVTSSAPTFGGSTFLRMIQVPGARLAATVAAWWRLSAHVDDRLDFATWRRVDGAWLLTGALKTAAFTRAIPVELSLRPYLLSWTRLELMPRRAVHPNRIYFREGNHALDRFVAAVRAHDVVVETYGDAGSDR